MRDFARLLVATIREIPYATADALDRFIMDVHYELPGSRGVEIGGRHGPFCWMCSKWLRGPRPVAWPCREHSLAASRIRERRQMRLDDAKARTT